MSAHHITVRDLMLKLAQYPPDLQVCVIYPGFADPDNWCEGKLAGPSEFEVVSVYEVRSGWDYPVPPDADPDRKVLVISDVGVQWVNDGNEPILEKP
jgi:hypothetical protein